MDDDDDVPPPLSSFEGQIEALEGKVKRTTIQNESLVVASTYICQGKDDKEEKKPGGMKKGFFSNKLVKPKVVKKVPDSPKPGAINSDEEIIYVKASKNAEKKAIPDFLKIEPSEEEKKYQKYKEDLIEKLKPTPDMISNISKDDQLVNSFNDPEIMKAVEDVAKNPQNFKKYSNNPKVMAFYSAMGRIAGEKLEKEGKKGSFT